MLLKLDQEYDYKNKSGQDIEILSIKRDNHFAGGFTVLAKLEGRKEPAWLAIDWFLPEKSLGK